MGPHRGSNIRPSPAPSPIPLQEHPPLHQPPPASLWPFRELTVGISPNSGWSQGHVRPPVLQVTLCGRQTLSPPPVDLEFEWNRPGLRTSWTARRSNQSILKDINSEYSLKGLRLKLKLQHFGHMIRRADSP